MTFVEDLTRAVFAAAGNASIETQPFRRTSYRESFERHLAIDVFETATDGLRALAAKRSLSIPPSLAEDDRDGWLNLLLADCIEPQLGIETPEFLYHYPASQGALAKIGDEGGHPVAERFELYIRGIELCNGYHELLDADELRRRNVEQSAIRAREGNRALPVESRLLDAMEAGLPACAGVALGFDRLTMLALERTSIAEVIAFPFARA
jgi:lysyl-tRNA synthetase class 2